MQLLLLVIYCTHLIIHAAYLVLVIEVISQVGLRIIDHLVVLVVPIAVIRRAILNVLIAVLLGIPDKIVQKLNEQLPV